MSKKLYIEFEKELLEETKRLAKLIYKPEEILYFKPIEFYKNVNKKYHYYNHYIEYYLVAVCDLIFNNKDIESFDTNIEEQFEHINRYILFKKQTENIDLVEVSKIIEKEIKNNIYEEDLCFEVIPELCEKYIKGHYDSMDFKTIIMLLDYNVILNLN